MHDKRQQLESAMADLEAQRATLGDTVVDAAQAPLRAELEALLQPELAQRLKHVSILFLDIVGSTTLAGRLDPEDVHAVLDGVLQRCTSIVRAHGGRVLQYAGDSLLAVFGAERAQEDDAERAVRAGLALLEEGRQQGEWVRRDLDHPAFQFRVGIHSGGVLLGGGVEAEGSVRGIAVHIAARMEQAAPPGRLRISHDTFRHVVGLFDVEPQELAHVKGVDAPVPSYLVRGPKPRTFRVPSRGIEGVPTRMVGRDAELVAMQETFTDVHRQRRAALLTVTGEAGLGKSRLLAEFTTWTEASVPPPCRFEGRADLQTQHRPYGLMRDVLMHHFQVADAGDMATAERQFEVAIGALFAGDSDAGSAVASAHVLGNFLGLRYAGSPHLAGALAEPRQVRQRAFDVAAEVFRRRAAGPAAVVLVLLEDLHWADSESLEFFGHLVAASSDLALMVLATARPLLDERFPHWPGRRVGLQPLAAAIERALALELLAPLPEAPESLVAMLAGAAEGNPFYMEEMIKMLVDQQAIEVSDGRWKLVPERLAEARIPHTLVGVLQSRLDMLLPAQKLALQEASVVGFVFWDRALEAIELHAPASLPGAERRQLVVAHAESAVEGAREYAFKHHLLHEVTYDTVLKPLKRRYHGRVAEWFASSARADEWLGVTAEHFDKAGDPVRAVQYLARAAAHAVDRHANDSAIRHVGRALSLLSGCAEDPAVQWALLEARERAFDVTGRRAEQRADIDALQAIAERLDDTGKRADAAWRTSNLHCRRGEFEDGARWAARAMDLAEAAALPVLRLRAQKLLAFAKSYLGDVGTAAALAQQGLADAQALGLRALENQFLNAIAAVALAKRDHTLALSAFKRQLPIARELGNRRSQATTHGNIGMLLRTFGQHEEAQQSLHQGLQMAQQVGDRHVECNALVDLALLALAMGRTELAERHAASALAIALDLAGLESEGRAQLAVGQAALALGRYGRAQAAFERTHELALRMQRMPSAHEAAAGLAQVALALDNTQHAMSLMNALLEFLEGGGTLWGTDAAAIQLACYQTLRRAGDPRADAVLARAHADLMAGAELIGDAALRHSYLNAIAHHRKIAALWAQSDQGRSEA